MTTIEKLESEGWREYPDQCKKHSRNFYKQFPTPTRCRCNDDKDGIQVCIDFYEPADRGCETFEVGLCGELPNGTWIRLFQWSLRNNLDAALALIPRMLSTWEFIANQK